MSKPHRFKHIGLSAGLFLVVSLIWTAPSSADTPNDLFDLSVEELINFQVTSVSGKAERLGDTTSAVFVITQDDIQRHGVRSIPDALRLAPGLSVLQIDANKWAVGSRGRTGRFANKLLVLMDGRLLYTPGFSGVFWDVQQTLIEEVDRIEIIRGPGAVVWGTNAVNGVINIITKSSASDPGGSVIGGLDPEGAEFLAVRQAGQLGESSTYRAFLNYQSADGNELIGGFPGADGWDLLRGSFRADRSHDDAEMSFTVEAYTGSMGETVTNFIPQPPYANVLPYEGNVSGAFAIGSWSMTHEDSARTSGQVYLDYTSRDSAMFSEDRTTISFDLQHHRSFGRHEIVAGGWLRFNRYDIGGSTRLSFLDEIDSDRVISAFVQDEITLVDDSLSVELGLKLENNELSQDDVEFMPTARLLWKPVENHSAWVAVTRSVRTPSIADLSAVVTDIGPALPPGDPLNPFPVPLRQGTIGNLAYESESNVSLELGLRGQLGDSLSYDVALFNMEYKDIRSFVLAGAFCSPSGVPVFVDPTCVIGSDSVISTALFTNDNDSRLHGGEMSLDWMPAESWRVRASASFVREDLEVAAGAFEPPSSYPEWQYSLRSEWSPTENISVAAFVRYVDEIEYFGIDDYWQANANVRWALRESWVVSLGVRNLLDDVTQEYQSELGDLVPTQIERSAFLNLSYTY